MQQFETQFSINRENTRKPPNYKHAIKIKENFQKYNENIPS